MLVAIACYERFVLPGPGLIETSKGAAATIYNILPRRIKGIPLLEYVWVCVV